MDKNYKIYENKAEIYLNRKLYNSIPVKKALINYESEFYITMQIIENEIIKIELILKEKEKEINLEKTVLEIYNDFLSETLRYEISIETKDIRELIIGRALYTTCINTEENLKKTENEEENFNLDEIARNWFDENK